METASREPACLIMLLNMSKKLLWNPGFRLPMGSLNASHLSSIRVSFQSLSGTYFFRIVCTIFSSKSSAHNCLTAVRTVSAKDSFARLSESFQIDSRTRQKVWNLHCDQIFQDICILNELDIALETDKEGCGIGQSG